MRILICDDEENIRNLMKRFLSLESFEADCAENGFSAQRLIGINKYDAILVDLKMPGMDGLELIEWIRVEGFKMPIIMISAYGEINDAVKALKIGAQDYITKPFNPENLVVKIKALIESYNIHNEILNSNNSESSFIGNSAEVKHIRDIIKKIGPSHATVLITGESGTGKEVVAREIHYASAVSGPFVAINIGGVPENLLESELFGYEKGAFTGAVGRKAGMFELASGGTLFLDEIGDMPLSLQVKILRVLQEKQITRLGSTTAIPINARIIAATNKNLDDMVKERTFREDLYYRLNVVRISIPPLRDRKDDIPLLSSHIISKYNNLMGTNITGFTPEALNILKRYDFYGNVRELENVLERAMIFTEGDVIDIRSLDLTSSISRTEDHLHHQYILDEESHSLKNMEKNAIIRALHRWEGNRTRAAEELGISRRTLITKIAEYNIDL